MSTPPHFSFKEYAKVPAVDVDNGILRQPAAVLGDEQPVTESLELSKGWYDIAQLESSQAPAVPMV